MDFKQIDIAFELINTYFKDYEKIVLFKYGDILLKFQEFFIPIIKKYSNDFKFYYRSNGALLERKIIDYLLDNNVRISCYLDGPKYIHDINRLTINKESIFDKVYDNINYLSALETDFSVISRFSNNNIDFIYDSYLFHMENPNNYNFYFNFDERNIDCINKKSLITELFKKIAQDYKNRTIEEKMKFYPIREFLTQTAQKKTFYLQIDSQRISLKPPWEDSQTLFPLNPNLIKKDSNAKSLTIGQRFNYQYNCKEKCKKCLIFNNGQCRVWIYNKDKNRAGSFLYCQLYDLIFDALKENNIKLFYPN